MNYLTLDLETTGLDTQISSPIQLAYEVRNHLGDLKEKRAFYIQPEKEILPNYMSPTGITYDALYNAVKPRDAVDQYHALVWRHQPCTLLGFNIINFDLPILQNWLTRNKSGNFKFPPIQQVIDVMFLAQQFLKMKKWPKLIYAAKALEIPVEEERFHEAGYDVAITWEIYSRINS